MANSYLVETATPGGTMIRQGTDVAIGRLHSTFTSKLEATIRQARQEGIKASVYSAYRPPGYKVGGYANKRNSLHAYGLAVDFAGIGRPGSTTAKRFYDIAVANGLHNPYGPANAKEWNHFQLVPQKGRQFLAANPELAKTITDAGPIDLDKMWAASGIPVTGLSDPFGVGASKAPPASVGFGASTIRPGQKSDDVKALQTALIGMGANISSPTGYYGPETRAAVEAFQKANGLKVDGVVGDDTKGMLGAAAYDSVPLEARDEAATFKAQQENYQQLSTALAQKAAMAAAPRIAESVASSDLAPGQAIPTPRMRAAGDPMSTPNHPAWDNPPPGYYAGSPWWSQPKPGEPGGMPLQDAQLQRMSATLGAAPGAGPITGGMRGGYNPDAAQSMGRASASPAARAEALRQQAIQRTANDPAFNSSLLGNGLRGSPEAQPSLRYNAPQGGGMLAASEARPSLRAQTAGANSAFADPRVQSIGNAPRRPDFDFAVGPANASAPSLAQFNDRFGGPANAPQRTVIGNPAGIDMAERRRFTPNQMVDSVESAAARRYAPQPPAALDSARNAAAMAASAAANAPTRQTAQNMASARAGASQAALQAARAAPQIASGATGGALNFAPEPAPPKTMSAAQFDARFGKPQPFTAPAPYTPTNPIAAAPIPRMNPIAGPAPVAPAMPAPVPPKFMNIPPLAKLAMGVAIPGIGMGISALNKIMGAGYNQATAANSARVSAGVQQSDMVGGRYGGASYGRKQSDGSVTGTTRSGTGYTSRNGGRDIDIGGRSYSTNRQGRYSLNVGKR